MIRRYVPEDLDQIKSLCERFKIAVPYESEVWVDDSNGKILGFIGRTAVPFIEPLITTNPGTGLKLYKKILNLFQSDKNVTFVRCITDRKNEELYKKLGFQTIETDKILMEKEINHGI